MSTVLSTSSTYLPFLCRALEFTPTALAQCIVCADAETGYPVAGVIYDGFNGSMIHAHIWVDAERKPSRDWFGAIFDYPFNRCGVKKIVGQVRSSNEEAIRLDEHFGFVREAEIKDYYEGGVSLLVYTMTREQCRVLNSPAWRRVNERISRVA